MTKDAIQDPDALNEVRKQYKNRRTSVMPQRDDNVDIIDAWQIFSIDQLQLWTQNRPTEVMEMLEDLRFQRDQCLHVAAKYNTMSQKKVDLEQKRNLLKADNVQLENNLMKCHNTIRDYKRKYLDASQQQLNAPYPTVKQAESEPFSPAEVLSAIRKKNKITRISDPAIFTNNDDLTWNAWSNAMLNKLIVNANHYSTERSRIIYIVNRVEDKTAKIVALRRQPESFNPYLTVKDVMNDLADAYKNIDRIENAMREYDSLRQNPAQTFRDFYSDFKLLDGELAYNETHLMHDLPKKLNPKLYIKFSGVSGLNEQFTSLTAIRDYLIKTDNAMRAKNLDDKQVEISKKTYTSRSGLSSIYVVPARRVTPVTTSTTSITPASKTPSAPVVKKEYICFQCERPGHQKTDCPNEQTQAGKKAALNARVHVMDAYDTENPIDDDEKYYDANSFDSRNA